MSRAPVTRLAPRARLDAWLLRWRPILPILLAEMILWIGFGALLPVLPLYMVERGIDPATLGLIVAAWPGARLVAEPAFGWLADRTARKPLMVGGLVGTAAVAVLPLFWIGALPFFLARAAAGIAAAVYDPSARGYLVDVTPEERRGEAFGLFGAAQMAGFLAGPAIGGLGAALISSYDFAFVFAGVAAAVASVSVALTIREQPHVHERAVIPGVESAELSTSSAGAALASGVSLPHVGGSDAAGLATRTVYLPPASLWNRMLVAAVVLNVGTYFASGTYEVIWSLYMQSLGAGLDLIGVSFVIFGIPVLLISPLAGKLTDRQGSFVLLAVSSAMVVVAAFTYPLVREPALALPVVVFEGVGFALLSPALYGVVVWGSPAGRSSTAQGIFGGAGTLGFVISSVVAGELWSRDHAFPFYFFGTVILLSTLLAFAIGRRRLDGVDPSLVRTVPLNSGGGAPERGAGEPFDARDVA